MSKYTPLGDFLASVETSEVPLTFAEIEHIVGTALPASSKYPAWWSNNSSNNVMTEVWLKAGFQTERVDVSGRKLVFRRAKQSSKPMGSGESASSTASRRHPIFGCMEGLMTIAPGVDVTAPADPSWGGQA